VGSEDTPSRRLLLAEKGRRPGRLSLVVLCAVESGPVVGLPGLGLGSSRGGGCGTSSAVDKGVICGNGATSAISGAKEA
jgi:hypothetical protein